MRSAKTMQNRNKMQNTWRMKEFRRRLETCCPLQSDHGCTAWWWWEPHKRKSICRASSLVTSKKRTQETSPKDNAKASELSRREMSELVFRLRRQHWHSPATEGAFRAQIWGLTALASCSRATEVQHSSSKDKADVSPESSFWDDTEIFCLKNKKMKSALMTSKERQKDLDRYHC